jgi:hypothetical protein
MIIAGTMTSLLFRHAAFDFVKGSDRGESIVA